MPWFLCKLSQIMSDTRITENGQNAGGFGSSRA
jgi:hypothetical protein